MVRNVIEYNEYTSDELLKMKKSEAIEGLNESQQRFCEAFVGSYNIKSALLKAGYDAELVAGVTSICAVAAKLNVSLCERAEPLIVLPGSYKEASKFLDGPGNKVLMKSASEIARVRDELKERGLIKNAAMVERCGLPGEKVYRDLNEIDPNSSYFSVILVKEKEFDK